MGIDPNGRSTMSHLDVPLAKVSDTESLSAKQPGLLWRLGPRAITGPVRSTKGYKAAGGAYEMHLGGEPHFIGVMYGHGEVTMQDGMAFRVAPGDFVYVRPGALHHSDFPSLTESVMFNLYLPGTADDTQELAIKT
jgi:mannose-6-phosphate isomerase-like protein (cupin superfamily)